MSQQDLEARIQRLEQLARGLAREVALWKGCNTTLLYLERKAYLSAIQNALAGAEAARVVLARAVQRGEKERTTEAQRAQRQETPRREEKSEKQGG